MYQRCQEFPSRGSQPGHEQGVQMAVGGESVACLNALLATHRGESATRFRKDDSHGGYVPDGHVGVEHRLGAATGHQKVAVTIAPTPRDTRLCSKIHPDLAPRAARDGEGRAIAQKSVGEV